MRWWLPVGAAGLIGVALAGGCAWSADPADSSDGSGSRSLPGVVACAETIAVGDVTAVSEQGDRVTVTLGAVRYLKPETGAATLTATAARPPGAPVKGDRALVVVHDAGDVDLFTGADVDAEWAWMERALPDSRGIDTGGCGGE
ncbi:hypothetical protein GCM10010168_45330 [Actinoplanes ianthinogenes]|uniref:Lipoprotein n=1 Tax=Actinoplanes ianthinogenes TaxID=122358 RepID=A0ABM7LPF8_9ACTN|nr:hypothetical protein Aiant_18260 [Actinoplanes ianthinogenes]GGR22442.1 hypothetical protein GCM10010168_45330 [Actinoplanes ianthinogenes]